MAQNKARGGRIVQLYLLRGMVRCESCGRNWRGKRYRSGNRAYYRYHCNSVSRGVTAFACDPFSVSGPRLEDLIWDRVVSFLSNPDVFLDATRGQRQESTDAEDAVKAAIKRLEERLTKLRHADSRAYGGYVRGVTSEETYRRVAAELKAERTWVVEELQRQHGVLEDARRAVVRGEAIKELYPRLVERIEQATFDDKRFVLECLDAVVTVGRSGVALSLAVPEQELSSASSSPGWAG